MCRKISLILCVILTLVCQDAIIVKLVFPTQLQWRHTLISESVHILICIKPWWYRSKPDRMYACTYVTDPSLVSCLTRVFAQSLPPDAPSINRRMSRQCPATIVIIIRICSDMSTCIRTSLKDWPALALAVESALCVASRRSTSSNTTAVWFFSWQPWLDTSANLQISRSCLAWNMHGIPVPAQVLKISQMKLRYQLRHSRNNA